MPLSTNKVVTWTALTCKLESADIYLGLAAGLDDLVAVHAGTDRIVAFPFRDIRVATGGTKRVPLRVYAVRNPSLVRIVPLPDAPRHDGFVRVKLEVNVDAPRTPRGVGSAGPGADSENEEGDVGSVMAFLMAIGLPRDREDDFYNRVVHEFLERSLMSLPKLLAEIGCSSAEDIADGTASSLAH